MTAETQGAPLTAEEVGSLRGQIAAMGPHELAAWSHLTVARLLATLDRERSTLSELRRQVEGLPDKFNGHPYGNVIDRAAVLALIDAARLNVALITDGEVCENRTPRRHTTEPGAREPRREPR